mgnify:CR=1 FL=1
MVSSDLAWPTTRAEATLVPMAFASCEVEDEGQAGRGAARGYCVRS